MQVVAFSTPLRPEWRWRIVNYAGEMIEESHETFPTIAAAVAAGSRHLGRMNVTDRSSRPRTFGRSASPARGR
jgi:hypothetical protein